MAYIWGAICSITNHPFSVPLIDPCRVPVIVPPFHGMLCNGGSVKWCLDHCVECCVDPCMERCMDRGMARGMDLCMDRSVDRCVDTGPRTARIWRAISVTIRVNIWCYIWDAMRNIARSAILNSSACYGLCFAIRVPILRPARASALTAILSQEFPPVSRTCSRRLAAGIDRRRRRINQMRTNRKV
jgi:hypothetical protein